MNVGILRIKDVWRLVKWRRKVPLNTCSRLQLTVVGISPPPSLISALSKIKKNVNLSVHTTLPSKCSISRRNSSSSRSRHQINLLRRPRLQERRNRSPVFGVQRRASNLGVLPQEYRHSRIDRRIESCITRRIRTRMLGEGASGMSVVACTLDEMAH